MITKETARQIYNCHQQIEEIGKIKSDMCEEVEKARERAAKDPRPIAENETSFGKYGKGMQLGVPDGICSSMRIFNISPEMANEELKQALGDDLCDYCPWKSGEIDHRCDSLCEGLYCDDALDAFLDENQGFFDDDAE